MATETISLQQGLQDKGYEEWVGEMIGMREVLRQFSNVSTNDVVGMRAPYLKPGRNTQYKVSEWGGSGRAVICWYIQRLQNNNKSSACMCWAVKELYCCWTYTVYIISVMPINFQLQYYTYQHFRYTIDVCGFVSFAHLGGHVSFALRLQIIVSFHHTYALHSIRWDRIMLARYRFKERKMTKRRKCKFIAWGFDITTLNSTFWDLY